MKTRIQNILLLILTIIILTSQLSAQAYNPFNVRDNEYRLLGLKRAKEAYEVARNDFDRQKTLFEKGLITSTDQERARAKYSDAEVNYQQSLLAVLFEEQYVSISKAVKYQSENGNRRVRLTLVNTSGATAEFQQLIGIEDDLFRSLQPDVVHNVYVSILNDENAIISRPYETKISELKFGEPQELDFGLLQDLDAVTIFLYYANGSQRTMKVFLEKDASENRVLVQSEQFSQEVELGKKATFDLTLELFSGLNNTFALEVVNLPGSINRFFKDPSGDVRLTQVKFTESSRTKEAAIEISLPDRPTNEVLMDVPIPFYVLVLPRDQLNDIPDLRTHQWTEKELNALDIGMVKLELLPRGKGKLLVRSRQLFHSIQSDNIVEMSIDIVNEGSRRLDNIELRADLPPDWDKEISPLSIPQLAIAGESRVNITIIPPENISPGKYEVRLQTSATSGGQPVLGLDKTVTIEIRPETNVFGTILLVLAIIGLVGGIVVYGIRLSRK